MTAAITERAQRLLGWKPETSWRDALGRQIAWHRRRADTA
jgi:nucleoside-diphosphate-sugar epimerase